MCPGVPSEMGGRSLASFRELQEATIGLLPLSMACSRLLEFVYPVPQAGMQSEGKDWPQTLTPHRSEMPGCHPLCSYAQGGISHVPPCMLQVHNMLIINDVICKITQGDHHYIPPCMAQIDYQ